jgi:hypothetical protein
MDNVRNCDSYIYNSVQGSNSLTLCSGNLIITLYFSILLHCIVQWVLQVMLPSACSFTVDVSLSYI